MSTDKPPKRTPSLNRRSTERSSARRGRDQDQEQRHAPVLRGSTLVITNLAKIIGLVIAVNEMVIRKDLRESVVAFCALCILGAQVAEDVFLHAIDRIFARGGVDVDDTAEEESG